MKGNKDLNSSSPHHHLSLSLRTSRNHQTTKTAEEEEEESDEIYPSKVGELQSGETEADTARDPRFVMYWMTTTQMIDKLEKAITAK